MKDFLREWLLVIGAMLTEIVMMPVYVISAFIKYPERTHGIKRCTRLILGSIIVTIECIICLIISPYYVAYRRTKK